MHVASAFLWNKQWYTIISSALPLFLCMFKNCLTILVLESSYY